MARTPKISPSERQWRAQDALRTLTEAERIRGDRTLMADVKKQANAQLKTLTKVTGSPAAAAKPAPKPRATTPRKPKS